jgi:uncharacterized protein (PEP-CTERM system associated)
LSATYSDSVGVGQTSLIQSLSNLGYDPETGQFISQRTRLAYTPALTGLDINDTVTRTQQGRATVNKSIGTNEVSMSAFAVKQSNVGKKTSHDNDNVNFKSDQSSLGLSTGWQRPITDTIAVSTVASFYYTNVDNNSSRGEVDPSDTVTGTLKTFVAQINFAYRIYENVSGSLGYRYQRRFADASRDEFTENALLIGITQRF